jgi:hypothetical protein
VVDCLLQPLDGPARSDGQQADGNTQPDGAARSVRAIAQLEGRGGSAGGTHVPLKAVGDGVVTYLIFTSIALGLVSAVLGIVRLSIPSLKDASILFSSTLSGIVKLRVKLP